MKIEIFGHTDIGKKRELNEDNYLCLGISEKITGQPKPFSLLAVADGIGGHAGGELASTITINTLKENTLLHLKKHGSSFLPKEVLEYSIQLANQAIFQKATQEAHYIGMGTTLTAGLVMGNKATLSNIGDSRAYLIRNESMNQITLDHSWKAEQLREKKISEKEISESPFKNMITRSLGYESNVEIDIFQIEFVDGDYLFLCTDGLYGPLSERQIMKVYRKLKKPEKICKKLIKLANKQGGNDNITGVIAYFGGEDSAVRQHSPSSDTERLDSIQIQDKLKSGS